MNKHTIIKYNNIAHLPSDYQQRVMDLGNFYQQLPFQHTYQVVETTDLDQAFADLPTDTEWVVVVAAGHTTQDRNLYDRLIGECRLLNATLMCHIMNFPDQYPHLHPQIFCIRYQHWLSMGSPSWAPDHQPYDFVSKQYEASPETFHDGYTPHWLRPVEGTQQYQGQFLQTGSQVIRACLEHGRMIYNIPEHIRHRKHHLYPDQMADEFGAFLAGGTYTGTHPAQKYYVELIDHLAATVRSQYYMLNTEPLTTYRSEHPITHYAGVASGLKLFCTMIRNGFDLNTAVTIFDFSEAALKFQRYLIDNWTGNLDTYQTVCDEFAAANPGYYPCRPTGPWEDTYQQMLQELGGLSRREFKNLWLDYCHREHQFLHINLYDENDQQALAAVCEPHQQSYVWISNAFWMEYSLIQQGRDSLSDRRSAFMQAIDETGAAVVVDTNDFWHQGLLTFPRNHATLTL